MGFNGENKQGLCRLIGIMSESRLGETQQIKHKNGLLPIFRCVFSTCISMLQGFSLVSLPEGSGWDKLTKRPYMEPVPCCV